MSGRMAADPGDAGRMLRAVLALAVLVAVSRAGAAVAAAPDSSAAAAPMRAASPFAGLPRTFT